LKGTRKGGRGVKKLVATLSTVLLLTATLTLSGGCSHGVPVLRGSEVVFKAARVGSVDLKVELARGQEARDIHAEGFYLSPACLSRLYELAGKTKDTE
jgi:hypothetical protein